MTLEARTHEAALRELGALFGVSPSYEDAFGRHAQASQEALVAVLRGLGAELADAGDAEHALRAERERRAARLVEPVHVAWDGVSVRVPVAVDEGRALRGRLLFEEGSTLEVDGSGDALTTPARLPFGLHTLEVESGDRRAATTIISAPTTAYDAPDQRSWGVFLPVYALRSADDWGIGDLGGARELLSLLAAHGGRLAGSTPLFAAFLDEPFQPSPYAPVSRLFWNEAFLDVPALPEFGLLDAHERTRAASAGRALQQQHAKLVDYRAVAAHKRSVLEACARALDRAGERQRSLNRFVAENPTLDDYAQFRAAVERHGGNWREWPASLRQGTIAGGDVDPAAVHYHRYVQWCMHQQLELLDEGPAGLYLDMPLGVHPDGYDAWRHRDVFVADMSIGAPPDPLATEGQDWGLPPLQPMAMRRTGHAYMAACLRAIFRHARAVRIDHVMALHRLFWIPAGMPASEGVYVRYPHEELWALSCLESQRRQATVVGEDLGTVPAEVREEMARHAIRRSYVMQFELQPEVAHEVVRTPPRCSLASVNTHDLLPFAAFWREQSDDVRGAVVHYLRERALLEGDGEADAARIARAAVLLLGRSDADIVVANLEDLWGEELPQNVPGTTDEQPNWRRRAKLDLAALATEPCVVDTFRQLDDARQRKQT